MGAVSDLKMEQVNYYYTGSHTLEEEQVFRAVPGSWKRILPSA